VKVLFIGRFQPFHNGHLEVLNEFLPKADSFTMLIGSAQESHTQRNPFTAGERFEMIKLSLEKENIEGIDIIPIMDINRYSIWVKHVESFTPPFDLVISNNPLTHRLFSEIGYEVISPEMYDRSKFSGEEIRRRILSNESWQDLVPKGVVMVIERIEGTERIRSISAKKEGEINV